MYDQAQAAISSPSAEVVDSASDYADAYGKPTFMDVDAAASDDEVWVRADDYDAPEAMEVAAEGPPEPDEDEMMSYLYFVQGHDVEQVLLNPKVFKMACKKLKFKPSVDLFASATHH